MISSLLFPLSSLRSLYFHNFFPPFPLLSLRSLFSLHSFTPYSAFSPFVPFIPIISSLLFPLQYLRSLYSHNFFTPFPPFVPSLPLFLQLPSLPLLSYVLELSWTLFPSSLILLPSIPLFSLLCLHPLFLLHHEAFHRLCLFKSLHFFDFRSVKEVKGFKRAKPVKGLEM